MIRFLAVLVSVLSFHFQFNMAEAASIGINSGLITHLNFESNASDISGNNNGGTLVGGTEFVADTVIGRFDSSNKVLRLDGATGFVYWGSTYGGSTMPVSLNGRTVLGMGFWVKPNQAYDYPNSSTARIFAELGFSVFGFEGGTTGAGSKFWVNNGNPSQGTSVEVNQWTHLYMQIDGTFQTLYKNGALLSQNPYTNPLNDTQQSFRIGNRASMFINADFDDFRLYNRALSNEEVAQLYLIPEPSSLSLLLAGGAVFAAARRRKVD